MSQVTDGSVNPRPSQPLDAMPASADPAPATPPVIVSRPDILGSIGPVPNVATPKPPTQLSRGQILDATEACLQELGYDGTTIRRIAKQLDCAVGSIYRYFDDKRALLAAVVQRRFEPVLERIEQGAPADASANLYAQIASEQPELYRLMFWLSSIGKTTQTNTLPDVVQRIVKGWTTQFGDERVVESFWAQLHGAIMQGRRIDDLLPATAISTAPAPGSETAPGSEAVPGSEASSADIAGQLPQG
ncbi:MAG: TetR/AcrR family transcriptional regulator [Planctomycetota bacterium]